MEELTYSQLKELYNSELTSRQKKYGKHTINLYTGILVLYVLVVSAIQYLYEPFSGEKHRYLMALVFPVGIVIGIIVNNIYVNKVYKTAEGAYMTAVNNLYMTLYGDTEVKIEYTNFIAIPRPYVIDIITEDGLRSINKSRITVGEQNVVRGVNYGGNVRNKVESAVKYKWGKYGHYTGEFTDVTMEITQELHDVLFTGNNVSVVDGVLVSQSESIEPKVKYIAMRNKVITQQRMGIDK